ncbi:MAG TPA: hypothetical protein VK756_06960 [Solirubrobacteraceae bacterium]|jgi:hypothetical protein|nr:hypothetical protein [Solirubrobacteraceae bacterium]
MRSRQLETALAVFAKETAARLQADVEAGAEVPFELAGGSARGRGPRLYRYEPLTEAFIRERWAPLRRLPSYGTAVALLESFDGLDRYLLAREAPLGSRGRKPRQRRAGADGARGGGPRADAALRALIEDVFAGQSAFEVREERLRAALERLDCAAHSSPAEVTLLASLHGLTISSPELALAPGLTLAQTDALGDVPEEALAPALEDGGGEPGGERAGRLLVAFTAEDTDVVAALGRGRAVLGELLRALRLFGDGRVTLGRLAWVRVGEGGWSARALPWGGRPHGMLIVSAEQEDELRAFCNLVARRAPREGELAWALTRFELGCERQSESEALSDYVLALRALLEPESRAEDPAESRADGPAKTFTSGLLALRLAALCALPAERVALEGRVEQALALEHAIVAGAASPPAGGEGLEVGEVVRGEYGGGDTLVRELAEHLRALLRDVICGHLEPDLVALADELIGRDDEPAEDLRDDPLQSGEIVDVLI